ncbi:hypothetical protein GC093_05280 [Paenibacillus sp. LMG 31456]|uniref:Heparinase n=1 Tax=Paenibacillus foliorum TaxID=2654974 RepID=A0A972GRS5_9BACL|nr:hypothetical protein [Paenibacillus foliorum]NOU92642.1 hypothetical protein [Paenibacillus foliorum]
MIGQTHTATERRNAIRKLAANKAIELPLLPSGFWFKSDIRDNFYYATHLFASCVERNSEDNRTEEQHNAAMQLAVDMIGNVLKLQVQDSDHPMYGHWPLGLGDNPAAAKAHPLPVELMGCLIILFYNKYQHTLPIELKSDMSLAILHIYQSDVYRHPIQHVHHHEAKHTALKLLLAHQFDDKELLEQGLGFLKQQLQHVREFGFKEYGCLPWHWHWIQAFTCVWELVDNPDVQQVVSEMLDLLWRLRADYYLKGTWVGAQSRQWPHDAPLDNNTLLDYIAFGDFPEPVAITRLEGASFYTYEVAEDIVKKAVDRSSPQEVKRNIRFAGLDGKVTEEAHTYVYITPDYAVGGVWERRDEFDNEQQRWDITLPLTSQAFTDGNHVNQALFFHPGAKYKSGDDRHASPYGEVLFHMDSLIQLWALPSSLPSLDANEANKEELVGCLPKGEWRFEKQSGYGRIGDVYMAFHLMNDFTYLEKTDRISISSTFEDGLNGVVMEVVACKEVAALGIDSLNSWAESMNNQRAAYTVIPSAAETGDKLSVVYKTRRNDVLSLTFGTNDYERTINGQPITFTDYQTGELPS